MKLFIVPSVSDNIITLTDKTTGYKDEGNDLLIFDGTFRYVDLMSVDVIIYHTPENLLKIKDISFRRHTFKDKRKTYLELDDDGYFTILHMELPTKEFVCNAYNLEKYRIIYTDGKYFYERYLGYDDKLSIQDVISLTEEDNLLPNLIFNFELLELVSVYKLQNYYLSLLLDTLNNSIFNSSNKTSSQIQMLKIYLDTIEYLCYHHLEIEASRLIYKINNCTNIYDGARLNKSKCGC